MNTITNYAEINTLLIDVTLKIDENNIKEFVYTSLELNAVEYSQDDIILLNYLYESNIYQVSIFNKKNKYPIFEIFRVYYLNKTVKNEYDLFLNKNFIVIYKNAKPYYFQKFDYKIISDDLIEYFYKKLNIKIINIYKIDCNKVEELKDKFLKEIDNTIFENINSKRNYSYYIYCSYLFLLILFCVYSYTNIKKEYLNQKLNNQVKKEENILLLKEKFKFNAFSEDIESLFEMLKKYKLKINHVHYQKNSLSLEFISLDKNSIYDFLDNYKNAILSNTIVYIENKKYYKCNTNVRIIKN